VMEHNLTAWLSSIPSGETQLHQWGNLGQKVYQRALFYLDILFLQGSKSS